MTNYLSLRLKAKHCRDLQILVPRIPTASFLIYPDGNSQPTQCIGWDDITKRAHQNFLGRKASREEILKWRQAFKDTGFVDVLAGIAESSESKQGNSRAQDYVIATYKTLMLRELDDNQSLSRWIQIYESQGLKAAIQSIGTDAAVAKTNQGLLNQVEGTVNDLRVKRGRLRISGWACQPYFASPMKIEIFAGGYRLKEPRKIAELTGNHASSADVQKTCRSGSSAYGFSVKPKALSLRKVSQEHLIVYATNTVTGERVKLETSKKLRIPNFNDDDD
ncbi:MAG: hypothetical protein HRT45_19490 [Bdellovibrionales bacterium]|nr:hypothetical protein [Bdellovibrionales bacterium]